MAEEKPVAPGTTPRDTEGETPLRVRRGRVESVDLYEIKDSELELLEKGSPADLQLNFAIFLLSTAFSAICSLATAKFDNDTTQTTFILVSVCGILIGTYLLISWWQNRTSLKSICEKIKQRMPTAATPSTEAEHPNE